MLVLTRKNQESVVVGGRDGGEYLLRITVIEIRGRRVILGFEAAQEIPVHRSELWEQRHPGGRSKSPVTQQCRGERRDGSTGG